MNPDEREIGFIKRLIDIVLGFLLASGVHRIRLHLSCTLATALGLMELFPLEKLDGGHGRNLTDLATPVVCVLISLEAIC